MLVYPKTRIRRNKKASWCRDLFAEYDLKVTDLIMPLFVIDGINRVEPIATMPDIFRYTIDKLVDKVKRLYEIGIRAVMLFPCLENNWKDNNGSEALNPNNIICRAIRAIKSNVPNIGVIADVALDPYTSHGMDGVLDDDEDVDNDGTVDILCKQALLLAKAGVDAVAPSDMMDGRVGAIRNILEAHQYCKTQVFSYSVKYNSSFYSPFRDAVGSKANLGKKNKSTYFTDYRNSAEAINEITLDISEGADAIIIKPGMIYLDIICHARRQFPGVPLLAYQVSGEYAMLTKAVKDDIISEKNAVLEVLHAFKRAGATGVITYCAEKVSQWITS